MLVHNDSHLREKSSVYGGSSKALAAAKKRAGLSSDTDVIEIALERLALEDDFGARLVRNKGTVPRELDI